MPSFSKVIRKKFDKRNLPLRNKSAKKMAKFKTAFQGFKKTCTIRKVEFMQFSDRINIVKNIGEKRAEKFNKLGIFTVLDLVEHFPRDYDDRSKFNTTDEIALNEVNTIKGSLSVKPEIQKKGKFTLVKAKIHDEKGSVEAVWFNQPYIRNSLEVGKKYIFTGKASLKYNTVQLESPDFEKFGDKELLSTGRIVPVYSSTYGLSQKIFRSIIRNVLDEINDELDEFIPKYIKDKYKLCDRRFAIFNIHFPENDESFFIARKRLVFEELFLLQVKLLQVKGFIKQKDCSVFIENFDTTEIRSALPFNLTDAQERVFAEILTDLKNNVTMNRLIQGDVGSGKTAIAMLSAYIIAKNGYQTALMAPTDVLAKQHYESFLNIFENLGIKCVLLSGGLKKSEKRRAYEYIELGVADIIIGTHAIIQDTVKYNNLGLVITDEQHRFGVRQRNKLAKKGDNPHIMVMTATPIPRTLALILYGDLDISIIDKLPPGRQKIDTLAVNSTYYERIYKFIAKEIDKGRQIYIICPTIEENENSETTKKSELKAVEQYTEKLKTEIFPNYRVECIHGKFKADYKNYVMEEFSNGNIDILVSTTVIEVGINVPNATIMLIENAERFGLAQLHQLRGRVGRGSEKSYCILVSDSKNKVAKERMKTMTSSTDGFEISEKDLNLRGPGDFFGTRQHGIPELKIANLYKDIEILKMVQKASEELYRKDPTLSKEENKRLSIEIEKFFKSAESLDLN